MFLTEINLKGVGDNMVGFLSQIGWIGDELFTTPEPRIQMKKIFLNIDTDGENTIIQHFHSKMAHRNCVMEKIHEYLS